MKSKILLLFLFTNSAYIMPSEAANFLIENAIDGNTFDNESIMKMYQCKCNHIRTCFYGISRHKREAGKGSRHSSHHVFDLKIQTKNNTFLCPFCDRTITKLQYLVYHINKQHQEALKEIQKGSASSPIVPLQSSYRDHKNSAEITDDTFLSHLTEEAFRAHLNAIAFEGCA